METTKPTFIYMRVSTTDQNLESQKFALLDYCQKQNITNYQFFSDHGISGAKESRPALNEMMARVERGECGQVVVFAFSRFARSVSHLLKALERFRAKNVRFLSMTEQLDTNSPSGLALFTILGALSQMEREIIRHRVIAGMNRARSVGKRIGRVRKRNDALIISLLEAGLSFREIARISKASHGSVSACKKEWLAKKAADEKKKIEELSQAIKSSPGSVEETVAQMKSMNLSSDLVDKVQEKLETTARENVRNIQGNAFETYD